MRPSTRGARSALRVCSRFYPVRRKAYLIVEGEVLWWGCFLCGDVCFLVGNLYRLYELGFDDGD